MVIRGSFLHHSQSFLSCCWNCPVIANLSRRTLWLNNFSPTYLVMTISQELLILGLSLVRMFHPIDISHIVMVYNYLGDIKSCRGIWPTLRGFKNHGVTYLLIMKRLYQWKSIKLTPGILTHSLSWSMALQNRFLLGAPQLELLISAGSPTHS